MGGLYPTSISLHYRSDLILSLHKTSMANNTGIYRELPNSLLLASVVFKFIAMIIGVFGNVTVIIIIIIIINHNIFTRYSFTT